MCLSKGASRRWQRQGKRIQYETVRKDRKREEEREKSETQSAHRVSKRKSKTHECRNGMDVGGNKSEKEKGVISTRLPKIITHSPLRDLELPGCHFDTVRGIKDIPRARCSSFAINLRTDDYADLNSELPRRRNRSRSLLRRRDRLSREMVCRTGEMRVAPRSDLRT